MIHPFLNTSPHLHLIISTFILFMHMKAPNSLSHWIPPHLQFPLQIFNSVTLISSFQLRASSPSIYIVNEYPFHLLYIYFLFTSTPLRSVMLALKFLVALIVMASAAVYAGDKSLRGIEAECHSIDSRATDLWCKQVKCIPQYADFCSTFDICKSDGFREAAVAAIAAFEKYGKCLKTKE
jgi:hypothetical protein